LLAAFAPYTLLRLVPFVEAGAAGHLEGVASSLPGRTMSAASTPGNVVNDLLGRSSAFTSPGGADGGGSDARTTEGARRLAANPGGGLHIADPATFDATRAGGVAGLPGSGAGAGAGASAGVGVSAGAGASAEAGVGVAAAAGPAAAVVVAGHRVASAARDRVLDAAEGLATHAGGDDGN
jgi:hypothetical protein